MNRLLILLFCLPGFALAQAPAFKHFDEVRAQFLADMKSGGVDATRCRMKHIESSADAHFVEVECDELPAKCVVAVHPTEVLMQPIGCVENPNYDPRPTAPKQTL